jgi:hypothetical protein
MAGLSGTFLLFMWLSLKTLIRIFSVRFRKQRDVVNHGRITTAFLLSVGTAESPLLLPERFCLKISHLQAN